MARTVRDAALESSCIAAHRDFDAGVGGRNPLNLAWLALERVSFMLS
jgi:hypothetical protein